jgi:hypothetical protein
MMMQSRDEIGKSGYDRLRCAIACSRLFLLIEGISPASFREYR